MTRDMVRIASPDWLTRDALPLALRTAEDRMRLAIELARRNFELDTGGPFAALVVEEASGKLLSAGVNRVVPEHCSSAHAEVVALSLAQAALGDHDLGAPGRPPHQLVVNWRPCLMCLGAVLWSGVSSLLIAGSGPELERLTGFDEGPVPERWREALEGRGVRITEGVLREEAVALFRGFGESGRLVYNGRRGAMPTS